MTIVVNSPFFTFNRVRLFRGNALGYRFGPRCGRGNRMGCGVRPVPLQDRENMLLPALTQQTRYVYFTRNGKEVSVLCYGQCKNKN